MKTKRFLTVLLVIAVMFTFSFSSAFAALPYGEEASTSEPIAEVSDFTGEGTFGISTVEQRTQVDALELAKAAQAGQYPVALQAKVDAAYDTAIAAVKAAKTAKEMTAAITAKDKALEKLALGGKTYEDLKDDIDWEGDISFTVGDTKVAVEYYLVPDAGLVIADHGVVTANDPIVFNWLMDQGYYGYVDDAAWKKVLSSPSVRNAVIDWLEDYYVGAVTFNDVYDPDNTDDTIVDLSKYGRRVYAEYLDVLDAVDTWAEKKTTTIDEYAAVLEKIEAYDDKYGFDGEYDDFAAAPSDFDDAALNKLYVAVDKWYIENLEDAIETIEKINTFAGYTDAKADIIAAAKKCLDVLDKYGMTGLTSEITYIMLIETDAAQTIGEALLEVIGADTDELKKAFADDAFTVYEVVKTDAEGNILTACFDDSADNVAAIEAARKAFDAYVADYMFIYEAVVKTVISLYNNSEVLANVALPSELKADETRLLAAEYNKTAGPAEAAKVDAATAAKVQAWLNNATVKVTTKALGNGKIRVQATVDTASFAKILAAMDDECTVTYKFYKKTAKATKFKGYSDRAVNYTTFTKLTKGTKYNFKCAITISDKDGNVIATKSYLGSTTGIRTAK